MSPVDDNEMRSANYIYLRGISKTRKYRKDLSRESDRKRNSSAFNFTKVKILLRHFLDTNMSQKNN